MAKIKISTPEYDLELENSELIPATESELKAIVKKATKTVEKDISEEVKKDSEAFKKEVIKEVNKELDRLFKEADSYVKTLVPKDGVDGKEGPQGPKGDRGDDGRDGLDGKDAEITQEIKDEIALSVESQLDPIIREESSGEAIVGKINDLETIPELQIDAKHIKNLPEATQKIITSGGARGVNVDNGSGQNIFADRLLFPGATVTNDNRSVTVTIPSTSDEEIQDIVGAMVVPGTNIDDITYDDGAGTLTINASSQVDDTAYDASWNGDTTTAPSKNAVYDKIESLGTGISTDTRANILAIASPTAGETWYATDIKRFYLYTGTGWVSSGTPFYADEVTSTNPDTTPVESRVSGYLEDVIYGKVLSYCGAKGLILSKDRVDTEGALGRSDEGRPTIYFDGEHKEFLIGVRIEKDGAEGGLPELQVTKGDNTEWVDLHNGDSDSLDANGLPIIHGWMEDFGLEAHHTIIDPN